MPGQDWGNPFKYPISDSSVPWNLTLRLQFCNYNAVLVAVGTTTYDSDACAWRASHWAIRSPTLHINALWRSIVACAAAGSS